ncbi:MAG: hypothetical protein KC423_16610 [Anaerolineales bacterium]|nr:hypothetical protein [Anaerolineales bacterium]MCB9431110.1 hypothetical protein [Ardenticatenaceae bacterium]
MNGIATTTTSWSGFRIELAKPPRTTITSLARGATLGQPGDSAQQLRVLNATLALLAQDAPIPPVRLRERAE